jgi:hypothetical protein
MEIWALGAAFGDIRHLCQVRKNVFYKQIPLQFDSGLALAFSRRDERKGREGSRGLDQSRGIVPRYVSWLTGHV